MQRTMGSCPDGVRYYACHLTGIDAEIFACVCGRRAAESYLKADSRDFYLMRSMEWARFEGEVNGIVDF